MGEILGLIAAGIVVLVLIRIGWAVVKAVINQAIEWERARIDTARQRADVALVRPDAITGLLPVHRAMIESCTDAALAMMAARIDSMRLPANVPHTLHYAPHVVHKGMAQAEPIAELEMHRDDPFVVPSFSELYRDGIINPSRILIGYHEQTHQPHSGDLKDMFSCLIIAKSGGGKTTLVRSLVAQTGLMGAKFAIIDPHGHSSEGLARALNPLSSHQLFAPAIDEKDIEHAMHYFMHLVENRRNGIDTSTDKRILAIDEINHLIDDLGDGFATDMARIAERGRKYNVFVFAAGQSAEASRAGGTAAMRKAFVGRFVLRADKDAVQRLIPDKKLLDMVPTLQNGHTIFVPTRSDPVPLAIPNTTEADLIACFGSQVVEPLRTPLLTPLREPLRTDTAMPDFVVADDVLSSGKAQQAIALFKSGATTKDVLQQVWEITTSGGDKYAKAAQEWQGIQRAYMVKSGG